MTRRICAGRRPTQYTGIRCYFPRCISTSAHDHLSRVVEEDERQAGMGGSSLGEEAPASSSWTTHHLLALQVVCAQCLPALDQVVFHRCPVSALRPSLPGLIVLLGPATDTRISACGAERDQAADVSEAGQRANGRDRQLAGDRRRVPFGRGPPRASCPGSQFPRPVPRSLARVPRREPADFPGRPDQETYNQFLAERWRALLDSEDSRDESLLQAFLERHPSLLPAHTASTAIPATVRSRSR